MFKEELWTRRIQKRINMRSRSDNIQRKPNGRRNYDIGQNPKEQNQETGGTKEIRKRGRTSMEG